ncbi:hypothetical protein F7725_001877 [Dissostichus mawsoni]|uniref:Ig-like domain-containing protein n=1 Tax=Dissostichus mawsoni TaxID=36200 RepID=A0A7J5Y3X4_DISMA|nr:hypothetical protein F7725_001877 [Dissostichus mawsoni]
MPWPPTELLSPGLSSVQAGLDLMESWSLGSIIDTNVLVRGPRLREHVFFKMYRGVCVSVPLLTLLVLTLVVPMGQACPRSCNCYQANEVHCTFRSLLSIPSGLPIHTRRINFGFNSISTIHDSSLAGLKKVELLMLHSNDLHHLPDEAFRDLKSLQILKLSYNKLREISSSLTFSGLTSLLRLYLDHNRLQHIHPRALLQLPSLRLLRLQGNRLHQLHPRTLCTLSLLNTYYFSTLRHLDLSNNSLTTLPRDTLATAPLLETLVLQANPWSCDCRMNWFLTWSLAHPGLMKCPGGPQCPICASPDSLQGQGLLEQTDPLCSSPVIASPGRDTPLETEHSEIQTSESFREPLGTASLGLSDQQGNSVDLVCNFTHSDSQDIAPPPDLSLSSSSPLPLALSLSLECPVERQSYEKLWRILAYYSETAVRLERHIMLSKAPALAYRYRQEPETEGYYHTGVQSSVKARPQWLLQPAISIQLNRAQSNSHKVQLIYSTRVSAHPDPASHPSVSSPSSHPWVLISTNQTTTELATVVGSKVELSCPLLSSGNPKVQWVQPDGSKLISPSSSLDGRLQASTSGLLIHKVQLSDAGIYYCIARAGKDVDVLPCAWQWRIPLFPLQESKWDLLSQQLLAFGSPAPHISWVLPDGNLVRQGLAVSGGLILQSNGSLSLPNPSLRDAGHYRCIAVNQYGSDFLSIQLELNSRHPPPLRTSFPTGPQSAAGRSTKIRAPLQEEEGSGDVAEEGERILAGRKRPRPLQPSPNRRLPIGKPVRRGPMREGALRRGGTPTSSTDQRRNRFKNRHRVTTNKQRIDPKKWADLLAKIRQKTVATNESEPVDEAKPTAETVEGGQDGDTGINEGLEDTERGRSEGAGEEAETEGSSLDETDLQEEGLQQIYPVNKEMLTPTDTNTDTETGTEIKTDTETGTEIKTDTETGTEIKTDTETGTEIKTDTETGTEIKIDTETGTEIQTDTETGTEIKTDTETGTEIKTDTDTDTEIKTATESTETQTNIENETESETEKATPQTESVTNTETQKEAVTLKPMSAANEIVPEPGEGDEPEANTNPSRTKPQNPRGGLFPNLVPNSRPQSPWNSRRRIGQRRRIINRPRGHPLTPRRPIPEPTNPRSQTETPVTTTDQMNMLMLVSTTTSPVMLLTRDHIETTSNDVVLNSQSSTISNTVGISTSATPSLTPSSSSITSLSPSHTKIHIDMVTHPANIPDTAKSTLFNTLTPAPTHSDATVVQTHSPNTHAETYTHGIQTHTKTHTSLGKHVDEPSSDPNVVLERNLSSEPYVSHSSISLSPTPSSIVSSTNRPSIDWRNPGTNSIPDSDSSRPQWPPSPSLPAAPGVPVVRSRPRIADPHIRTVSVPAESTARLACEAQGEPKPSITWTKVSTGAVMSILSKAERFEVLPNGTLVIQNIQLQDRGTYICSAQSFLGRDRLLSNLEVWTRPPRMQLASYREVTIHQGGEVHLQCQADGVPSPLLSWVLPDRSVLTSSAASTSRIIMDTNGTLHIPVTLTGDRGVYRCVASNSAGAVSASARVHVSSLPPVIQQAKEEHLLLSPGRPVYAHCSARGAPTPTLRWRIPDGTIVRQSQFLHGNIFVLPNGTLHIRGVRPKDSGNYECIASNAVGADKRTVRVEIEGSAEGERSQSEARHEGAKAVEKTSSSLNKDRTLSIPSHPSNPFNSARLPASSPHDRSGTLPSRSSFYPRPPTLTNSLPKINKTVTPYPTHLSNINKTKLSPLSPSSTMPTNNTKVSPGIVNKTKVISPPPSKKYTASAALHPLPVSPFSKALIVSTSPSSSTVHYGLFLQLHCSVTGNPAPIIIWRTPIRKLVDVHYSFDHRLKVHPNGTLSIRALTEKDAGDYLCIARNKVSDDYRRLRVSVVTKPAKIEPKQPLNQMVDCQASGLPDPSVRWSLPDGTMVNSVLQGEDRGGRTRRLTVFDNGTLLVPAVGMGEEGEYTCYAENQGGQDTMKVKVKIMRTSLPTFTDDRSHHVVKVREGATATIPCQATGVPAPTVTWFSPTRRVIPKSLGSGFYSERVVVVSGGTLEVRLAQKIDTGTYTCRAINSAGERSMLVGLEVEAANHGQSGRWEEEPDSGHGSRSGESTNNARIRQDGFTNGDTGKLGSSDSRNNAYSANDGRTKNIVPNDGTNIATGGFYPALRSDSRDGLNRPVSGITTQLGRSVISVGVSGAGNIGIKADNIGTNQNGPGIMSNSNSLSSSHSTVRSDNVERNPGTTTNEAGNGAYTGRENGRISVSNTGAGTGSLSGNVFSRSSSNAVIAAGTKNYSNTVVGVVTTVKQRAVKGQTVVLPCLSQGSPPPRVAWILPGNGVLPAPYYGSRLTVHRNGSLELRGVRASDSGTLVCVVRSERGQTSIQVELEVSEPQEEARLSHRGRADERPVMGHVGVIEAPRPGSSLDSAKSLSSRPVLPEALHPKIQVTQKPLHRGQSLPAAPRPVGPPPRSSSPVSEPAVSTRTAPLVSIVNGENLRLPCPAPQTHGYTQGSLSWTMPNGKVLNRGESDDSGRYKVQEDGILTVQQASVYDRGIFSCISTSGDSVSVITVPVIVIAYPPRITTGPSPVTYTRPGVAVELPCRTIATPRATVTWEHQT